MEQQNHTMVPVSALETNGGQITGLPRNPRLIRDARYEKLKQSLAECPEFMGLRPVIAVSQGEGRPAVVICGNMRLRACADLGWAEIPAIVLPADTDPAKLREYAVKDNIPYGEPDWDILADEWDEAELAGWGMELPYPGKWDSMEDIEGDYEPPSQGQGVKITVDIPYEDADKEREIRLVVTEAVRDYNVTVR